MGWESGELQKLIPPKVASSSVIYGEVLCTKKINI